jgi:hypothetical protein
MKRVFIEIVEAIISQRLLNTDDKVIIVRTLVLSICSSEGIKLAINIKVKTLIFNVNESRKTVGSFCHVNNNVV